MTSPAMPERFTSPRFSLRLLVPSDIHTLHALWVDPEVRWFLWDGEKIPKQQTADVLEANLGLFAERGFGLWGVRDRGELIGVVGFWHFRDPPERELLFAVARRHWSRGVATEAATEVIARSRDTFGWETIYASTDVGNEASSRVLGKLGFELVRRERVDGLETLFYESTGEEPVVKEET